ncbi:MAG: hypothetical protein M1561_01320 [Gammaproteobacteria bacterium]|nr:hypothetical protein [Gammaproteobacteria bacterium]
MKDSVLIYSRPTWREWWWRVAAEAFDKFHLVGLSEFKNKHDICLMDYFYNYWEKSTKITDNSILPVEDVRLRCRLLRNLPKETSLKMITCAWAAINAVLEEVKPKYVLSITVDAYIVDLLARACHGHGIRFIGISNCPITGYVLISERGEHNIIREPEKDEIAKVLDLLLTDDYKPKYLIGNKPYSVFGHVKRNIIYRVKELVCLIKRRNDYFNYHLMVLPYSADKKHMFGYRDIKYFNNDCLEGWGSNDLPKLYIPLHFFPEATVSYWTKTTSLIDYENVLINVAKILSEFFSIAIKEHPAAIGTRSGVFYKRLQELKNIILVHPDYNSQHLIKKCDAVLTWTGTVGLEAALRGKKVIVLGDPYYYIKDYFIKISDVRELQEFDLNAFQIRDTHISHHIIKHVLSGTIEGAFCQAGYMSDKNAALLGRGLRNFVHDLY